MRHIKDILIESSKKEDDDKKKKEKKIVFVETDPNEAFPNDCMSSLQKDINKKAKDLEIDWKSSVEVVDAAFLELDVPKPLAYHQKRWAQYRELLDFAIKNLYDARGLKANWINTI